MEFVDADSGVLVKRVKPDFKKLGPKFGKQMKAVAAVLAGLDTPAINRLERDGSIKINLDGTEATVEAADVEIISEDIPGWLVANEGSLTIALDIVVSDDLKREGIARDIINRVQNIRKERDYNITDRITLVFEPSQLIDDAVKEYSEYISRQVLADSIVSAPVDHANPDVAELKLDDADVFVRISLA